MVVFVEEERIQRDANNLFRYPVVVADFEIARSELFIPVDPI